MMGEGQGWEESMNRRIEAIVLLEPVRGHRDAAASTVIKGRGGPGRMPQCGSEKPAAHRTTGSLLRRSCSASERKSRRAAECVVSYAES